MFPPPEESALFTQMGRLVLVVDGVSTVVLFLWQYLVTL